MMDVSELEIDHKHCHFCIKSWRCNIRPQEGYSCEIILCSQDCGSRFHRCKSSEHKLLCSNEKVHCINRGNGCPVVMPRHKTGSHLETCPASVVHCTMEWNRWPVCSVQEQALHLPLKGRNIKMESSKQLDVALAMRDQRMLDQWFEAPKKTKRVLRNSLTRRYPAVPFNSHLGNEDCELATHDSNHTSDEEVDSPWETRKAPPGLQQSVCQELYKASMRATESLSAAIDLATLGQTVEHDMKDEDKENIDIVNESISEMQAAEPDSFTASYDYRFEDDLMDVACNNKQTDPKMFQDMIDILKSNHKHQNVNSKPCEHLFIDNNIVSDISSASMIDHARQQPSPPFVLHSNLISLEDKKSANNSSPLGLNLMLESVTRYETKPKSMYTFLCAQEFRRDEYRWHYKNIHSDIHGGLNGWLEQRCPLAHYGCMFSTRRFFPTAKGASIVHNDILESFGIQPPICLAQKDEPNDFLENRSVSTTWKNLKRYPATSHQLMLHDQKSMDVIHEDQDSPFPCTEHCFSLLNLPFEILQNICRCLDSFSLCNTAMTCHLLREVCRSLLEERGLVVIQWERIKKADTYSWRVAYKRWFFSTAVTPIRSWGFEEKEHLGNHLKSCSFFKRDVSHEPYFYPFGIKPNPDILCKLKKSILGCNHENLSPDS